MVAVCFGVVFDDFDAFVSDVSCVEWSLGVADTVLAVLVLGELRPTEAREIRDCN